MALTPSDDEVIKALAEMADSQTPPISPIKSPRKRSCDTDGRNEDEIPTSEPAPKRSRPNEALHKNLRNRLAALQTKRAKCKRCTVVLREHANKNTCPVGLQYRPKPHLRFDQQFQTALNRICRKAQSINHPSMIQQQEKNLVADNQAIAAVQQQLESSPPEIQQTSVAVPKAYRPKTRARPNQHSTNSKPDFVSMQNQIHELQKMLCKFQNEAINKNRVEPYSCVSLSDSKGRKGNPKMNNRKRSLRRKTSINT